MPRKLILLGVGFDTLLFLLFVLSLYKNYFFAALFFGVGILLEIYAILKNKISP